MKEIKPIKMGYSIVLFLIPGIVFYLLVKVLMPYLLETLSINDVLLWTIVGTLGLFAPLFLLSLILMKADGYPLNWATVSTRFRLKRMEKTDWLWILGGFGVCTAISGIVLGIWALSPIPFDINDLRKIAPIEVQQLEGIEMLIFLPMLVLFFFNYVGEEFLWRGYILPRQEVALGKYAWLVSAGLHTVFHFLFGLKAMIPFAPFMLLLPYVAYKTKSTTNSIIIHALLGAPMMVLVSLGLIRS
jgi:membrane protease YdiL (CAAX protease family)